jgi:hypothetical protein
MPSQGLGLRAVIGLRERWVLAFPCGGPRQFKQICRLGIQCVRVVLREESSFAG